VEIWSASYYRARYYDPNTGRFLSEDPTTFEGGINLYLYDYVWNSANNLVDRSGP
jgi:RHS repeat-associated protein